MQKVEHFVKLKEAVEMCHCKTKTMQVMILPSCAGQHAKGI